VSLDVCHIQLLADRVEYEGSREPTGWNQSFQTGFLVYRVKINDCDRVLGSVGDIEVATRAIECQSVG
jgi:hypothetical protein